MNLGVTVCVTGDETGKQIDKQAGMEEKYRGGEREKEVFVFDSFLLDYLRQEKFQSDRF